MPVTIIEVCTHFQSFPSTEWCHIILHLSLQGLCVEPWYTADELHCEVLILLISKEKHWQDCVPVHCSHQICPMALKGLSTPAPYFLISGSVVFWNGRPRLWNATKKGSQNSALWFYPCINYAAEVRHALSNSTKSTKLVTEETHWECFFIWCRKMWALRRVFHPMTTQCSCWVVWQQKTTDSIKPEEP